MKSGSGSKKRKSSRASRQLDVETAGAGGSSPGGSSSEDEVTAKLGKPRNRRNDDQRSLGCGQRVLLVFAAVFALLMRDMAAAQTLFFVDESSYARKGDETSTAADRLLAKLRSQSAKKYRDLEVLERMEADSKRTTLLLARVGALQRPHEELERDRIIHALSGDEIAKPSSASEEENEAFSVTLSSEQVRKMNDKVEAELERKQSRQRFEVRHGGYDLDDAKALDRKGKIHTGMELVDFFAEAHARAEREKELKELEEAKKEEESSKDAESSGAGVGTNANVPPGVEVASRMEVFAIREPDPEFAKFVQELRRDNTYAHFARKNDIERALKGLGYKQSTKSSRKTPLIFGDENKCQSQFKKEETRISFCPLYVPPNKADQYHHIQAFAEKIPESMLKPDFYPDTWRLWHMDERANLKIHCTNESMTEFGVAYVRKFTVPGDNYMKSAETIYEQLLKSDKSNKQLVKETKNRAVVQLYINNPFLIEGRKFIIRTFAVIVSNKPMIVFYNDGAIYRSIVKYTPFTRHDSDYKKAAHITSEQKSASKKVLKSSELYMSFGTLQRYLAEAFNEADYVDRVLRPHMKAKMIHALYAIMRRQRSIDQDDSGGDRAESLPVSTAVVQEACFDFLLDENKKLWLITVGTGSHCFVNMGGSSFRPSWKSRMQTELSENTAQLAEEMLWRRQSKKPISSMSIFTRTKMTVLIDETFPDWDVTKEINDHMMGIQVAQDNRDYNREAKADKYGDGDGNGDGDDGEIDEDDQEDFSTEENDD